MKARPRSVEREVAQLVQYFQRIWYPDAEIQRIPVLGRTGPDIDLGPMGLAIDVKSRLSISDSVMAPKGKAIGMADGQEVMVGFRLSELADFMRSFDIKRTTLVRKNKAIYDWWHHMDEWSQENGRLTSAIVAHKPKSHIARATIWFDYDQFENFRRYHDAKNND